MRQVDNIYDSPEKFGLVVVTEEDLGGAYEFDKWIVWRKVCKDCLAKRTVGVCCSSGRLYCANDSGCSCPTPFDGFTLEVCDSIEEHIAKVRSTIRDKSTSQYYKDDVRKLSSYLRELLELLPVQPVPSYPIKAV